VRKTDGGPELSARENASRKSGTATARRSQH